MERHGPSTPHRSLVDAPSVVKRQAQRAPADTKRHTPRTLAATAPGPTRTPPPPSRGRLLVGSRRPNMPDNEGFVTRGLRSVGHGVVDTVSSLVGNAADSFITKILGIGSYTVKKNSLMDLNTGMLPMFGEENWMEIVRQEYLGDITSSVGFKCTAFPINPGLSRTFPWGSTLAGNFTQYYPDGMIAEAKSLCATAVFSSNPSIGAWGICTSYDASAPPPRDKREAETYMMASSSAPSESIVHPIECDPSIAVTDAPFVRTDDTPPGPDDDIRLYDWANMYVWTEGQPIDGAVLGELWWSYRIRLFKPLLDAARRGSFVSFSFRSRNADACYTPPTRYAYSPSSTNITMDVEGSRPYVMFAAGTKGLFRIIYTTFAETDNTGTGGITHGAIANPSTELNVRSETGEIAYLNNTQMSSMYSANFTAYAPNSDGGSGQSCTTTDNGASACANPTTIVYVSVDNTASIYTTSAVQLPNTFMTGLTTAPATAGSMVIVETVNSTGNPFNALTARGEPTPRKELLRRSRRMPISLNPHLGRFAEQPTRVERKTECKAEAAPVTVAASTPRLTIVAHPTAESTLRTLGFTTNAAGEWVNIEPLKK